MTDRLVTRPWRDGDHERLLASEPLFSPETLAQRFFTGMPRFPTPYVKALRRSRTREHGWLGQVAIDEDRVVALAECAWEPAGPARPEIAVMVADAWQRNGLGRLLHQLLRRCLEAGLTVVDVEWLATNRAATALMASITTDLGHRGARRVETSAGTCRQTARIGVHPAELLGLSSGGRPQPAAVDVVRRADRVACPG